MNDLTERIRRLIEIILRLDEALSAEDAAQHDHTALALSLLDLVEQVPESPAGRLFSYDLQQRVWSAEAPSLLHATSLALRKASGSNTCDHLIKALFQFSLKLALPGDVSPVLRFAMRALDDVTTAKATTIVALIRSMIDSSDDAQISQQMQNKLISGAKDKLGNCYNENRSIGGPILLCCSLVNRFSLNDDQAKWTLRLTFERIHRHTKAKFKEPIYNEIADIFEGVALLLEKHSHVFTDIQKQQIYAMWCQFVQPETMSHRSSVVFQGLNLMIAHCSHFMDWILPEYKVFYTNSVNFALRDHRNQRDVRNAAYKLVEVFLRNLSDRLERMIADKRDSADIILKYMGGSLSRCISLDDNDKDGNNSDRRLHNLAMAIAGLGILPGRVFDLPDCVNLSLDDMIARVRQLFVDDRSNVQTRTIFLTKFLDALVRIAERNRRVTDATACWTAIEQMTLMQVGALVMMDNFQVGQLARLIVQLFTHHRSDLPDLLRNVLMVLSTAEMGDAVTAGFIRLFSDMSKTMQKASEWPDCCQSTVKSVNQLIDSLNLQPLLDSGDQSTEAKQRANDRVVFQRVVAFFCAFLEHVPIGDSLRNIVWTMLIHMMNRYRTFPDADGFLSMVGAILAYAKKLDVCQKWNESDLDGMKNFTGFVNEILSNVIAREADFVFTALYLILALPVNFVLPRFDEAVAAVVIALKLGLSWGSLAIRAIGALETWLPQLDEDRASRLCEQCLPLLGDYLASETIQKENEVDIATKKKKQKRIQRSSVLFGRKMRWSEENSGGGGEKEFSIQEIRLRIFRLLGQLGFRYNRHVIEKDENHIAQYSAWHYKKFFSCKLDFGDQRIDFQLDDLFPVAFDLALNAVDEQLRATACETAHSLTLLALAEQRMLSQDIHEQLIFFDYLFDQVAQLASCGHSLGEQLFKPLMLQIVRYFVESQRPPQFLEHLIKYFLDRVTDEKNPGMRQLAVNGLRELTQCTLGMTGASNLSAIDGVLDQLCIYAEHSSPERRLGAALGLNAIYTMIREDERLVERRVFQLLSVYFRSSTLCALKSEAEPCLKVIANIQRMILGTINGKSPYFERLMKENSERILPHGWSSASTEAALKWMFEENLSRPEAFVRIAGWSFVHLLVELDDGPNPRAYLERVLGMELPTFTNRLLEELEILRSEEKAFYDLRAALLMWFVQAIQRGYQTIDEFYQDQRLVKHLAATVTDFSSSVNREKASLSTRSESLHSALWLTDAWLNTDVGHVQDLTEEYFRFLIDFIVMPGEFAVEKVTELLDMVKKLVEFCANASDNTSIKQKLKDYALRTFPLNETILVFTDYDFNDLSYKTGIVRLYRILADTGCLIFPLDCDKVFRRIFGALDRSTIHGEFYEEIVSCCLHFKTDITRVVTVMTSIAKDPRAVHFFLEDFAENAGSYLDAMANRQEKPLELLENLLRQLRGERRLCKRFGPTFSTAILDRFDRMRLENDVIALCTVLKHLTFVDNQMTAQQPVHSVLPGILQWIVNAIENARDGDTDLKVTLLGLLGELGRNVESAEFQMQLDSIWQQAIGLVIPSYAEEFDQSHVRLMKVLLASVTASQNGNALLVQIINIIFHDDSHPARVLFERFVDQYADRQTGHRAIVQWTALMRMCMNESGARTEKAEKRRLRVLRNVLLPMLSRHDEMQVLKEFYVDTVWPMMETAMLRKQVDLLKSSGQTVTEIIWMEWLGFVLTSLDNREVDDLVAKIGLKTADAALRNDFRKWICLRCRATVGSRLVQTSLQSWQLQCAAQNLFIAVILRSKIPTNEPQSRLDTLFEDYIWSAMAGEDEKVHYALYETVQRLPERRRRPTARRAVASRNDLMSYSSLSMLSSSISGSEFDFTEASTSSQSRSGFAGRRSNTTSKETIGAKAMDSDDLNSSPCMENTITVFKYFLKLSPVRSNAIPKWLRSMVTVLGDRSASKNSRLFLLRLVDHLDTLLKPVASTLLPVMMEAVLDLETSDVPLNSVFVDVVLTALHWSEDQAKLNIDLALIGRMLQRVIDHAFQSDITEICKRNLRIAEEMLKKWPNAIFDSSKFHDDTMTELQSNGAKLRWFIQLTTVLVAAGRERIFEPEELDRLSDFGVMKTLRSPVPHLIGALLQAFENSNADYFNSLWQRTSAHLQSLQRQRTPEDTIRIISEIADYYPPIADRYQMDISAGVRKPKCRTRALKLLGDIAGTGKTIPELDAGDYVGLLEELSSDPRDMLLYLSLVDRLCQAENLGSDRTIETVSKAIYEKLKNMDAACRMGILKIARTLAEKFKDVEDGNGIRSPSEQCMKIFLADVDSEIQNEAIAFWNASLPTNLVDRAAAVLALDLPDLHTVLRLLIAGCISHRDFDRSLFEALADDSAFQRLALDTRATGSLSTVAADVLDLHGKDGGGLNFEPTQFNDGSGSNFTMNRSLDAAGFADGNDASFESRKSGNEEGSFASQNLELYKLKRKILTDPEESRRIFIYRAKAANQRAESAETAVQRQNLQLFRTYRTGRVPDVKISLRDLLLPLLGLAGRDSRFAAFAFGSVIGPILKLDIRLLKPILVNALNKLVDDGAHLSSILTIAHIQNLPLDATSVTSLALDNGREWAAVEWLQGQLTKINSGREDEEDDLLMEKRPRRESNGDARRNEWLQLARLYKAIDKPEVVLGIYADRIGLSSASLKLALKLQGEGQFKAALEEYEKLLDTDAMDHDSQQAVGYERQIVEAERWQCLASLNRWSELSTMVFSLPGEDRSVANADEIWNLEGNLLMQADERKRTYLGELLRSNLRLVDSENSSERNDRFWEAESRWMVDADRQAVLKKYFGVELVHRSLQTNQIDLAKSLLTGTMQQALADWSTVGERQRMKLLETSEALHDFSHFIRLLCKPSLDGILELCSSWRPLKSRFVSTRDMDSLERLTSRRCFLLRALTALNLEWNFDEKSRLFKEISSAIVEHRLEYASQLCRSGHLDSSESVLRDLRQPVSICGNEELISQYMNTYAMVQMRMGEIETEHPHCVNRIAAGAVVLMQDQKRRAGDSQTTQDSFLGLGEMCWILHRRLREMPQTDWSLVTNNSRAVISHLAQLKDTRVSLRDLRNQLANQALQYLQGTTNARLQLINFCQYCLKEGIEAGGHQPTALAQLIISNVLDLMADGNRQAQLMFPDLLHLLQVYPTSRETFVAKTIIVPSWMFLFWVNQLIGRLDTDAAIALFPLVERLADEYPQAVQYPFFVSRRKWQLATVERKKAADRLEQILRAKNLHLLEFSTALDRHFQLPSTLIHSDGGNLLKSVLTTLREFLFSPSKGAGDFWRSFAERFATKFPDDSETDGTVIRGALASFKREVMAFENEQRNARDGRSKRLDFYSKWLSDYRSQPELPLEIPGQYIELTRPDPTRHVLIYSFEPRIREMHSKARPKVITVLGNDGRTYQYLIKPGEDLRVDERIEQLFTVVNELLTINQNGSNDESLLLNTYRIIPISEKVGLIQMVSNVSDVRELLERNMSKRELDLKGQIWARYFHNHCINLPSTPGARSYDYAGWIKQFGWNSGPECLKNARRAFQSDLLKRAIEQLSTDITAMALMKRRLCISHAAMSAVHWVLGIGDRHLQNLLINTKTGAMVGIDFGHAFGTAVTDLPIPELIPFRLTGQLENAIGQLSISTTFLATMSRVLQVMRDQAPLLGNLMRVFIEEPSVNWSERANSTVAARAGAAHRIRVSQRKLKGEHPSVILRDQLLESSALDGRRLPLREMLPDAFTNEEHEDTPPMDTVESETGSSIAVEQNQSLHVDTQCRVLLDMARNEALLSRIYEGWEPWL